MELALAALADHASIDQGGKLSLIGIFDTIWSKDVPVRHRDFCFVARFRLELGEALRRVVIHDPKAPEGDRNGAPPIGLSKPVLSDALR